MLMLGGLLKQPERGVSSKGLRLTTRLKQGGFGAASVISLFLLCPTKECKWAARHRRTAQPLGQRCERCTIVCRQAFPLLAWDDLVIRLCGDTHIA